MNVLPSKTLRCVQCCMWVTSMFCVFCCIRERHAWSDFPKGNGRHTVWVSSNICYLVVSTVDYRYLVYVLWAPLKYSLCLCLSVSAFVSFSCVCLPFAFWRSVCLSQPLSWAFFHVVCSPMLPCSESFLIKIVLKSKTVLFNRNLSVLLSYVSFSDSLLVGWLAWDTVASCGTW